MTKAAIWTVVSLSSPVVLVGGYFVSLLVMGIFIQSEKDNLLGFLFGLVIALGLSGILGCGAALYGIMRNDRTSKRQYIWLGLSYGALAMNLATTTTAAYWIFMWLVKKMGY